MPKASKGVAVSGAITDIFTATVSSTTVVVYPVASGITGGTP